jgi:hypothetical protein
MALTLGSASINADTAAETVSGMCGTFYAALKAQMTPSEPTDVKARAASLAALASLATAIATAMHSELTVNARAQILTTDAGLQREPGASLDTLGPLTTKTIRII